ncbi:MAG: aminodeoxychorismate/anthranilate synthase component II [Syntrophomonadaceae bacterium]|jgi:anthranilate synthase/aminodeoxychorismate synthase-like glutamine amidotransferase|nr:aminodeoxychorismate/anthranilate synthase component II [Syntrophomonadaceae bacterium]
MLLVIDNYDSFTYNLVQYLGMLGADIKVVRNDQASLLDIIALQPEKIVISPGPGTPAAAGVCNEVIRQLSGKIPILGVCLGHQCIGEVFGFPVVPAATLLHGKTSLIYHSGDSLFSGIPQGIRVARYHSLVLEKDHAALDLQIVARTEDGTIMAVQHVSHPTFGVQFHPESVATEYGFDILQNFLTRSGLDTSVKEVARN